MWQKVFSVLGVSCFSLLAACSSLPAGDALPAADEAPAESAALAEGAWLADESRLVLESIALGQRMAVAPADEQRQELSGAARAFTRQRSSASRLRYGMLLALPALPGADAQRALATLEPLSASGPVGPLRQFATLLVQQIGERLKELRRAQQLKEQVDEARASERGLNERASQLRIQLDELRAIERALIERGRPTK